MAVYYPQQPSFQYVPKVRWAWINEAWDYYKQAAGTWIGATLILLLAGLIAAALVAVPSGVVDALMAMGRISPAERAANPFAIYAIYEMPAYWVTILVSSLVSAFFMSGMLKMAIAQLRGERIDIGMLFSGAAVFLPLFGYSIALAICGAIGTELCIFPGLVVYAYFTPGLALIADGLPFGEAMNRSVNGMKGDWLMGCLFVFVYGLIYLLGGSVTCGLGFFVFFPMGIIIMALVYRDMIGMPGGPASGDPYNQSYGMPPGGSAQPGVWPPSPIAGPSPTAQPPAPARPFNIPPPPGTQPASDSYKPPTEGEKDQGGEQ